MRVGGGECKVSFESLNELWAVKVKSENHTSSIIKEISFNASELN